MTVYAHLAMATALFPLAGIVFMPTSLALPISAAVALIGVMFFGGRSRPLLWLFPLAMALTALWSPAPLFTLQNTLTLFVPVVLAGVVVAICGPQRFMRTLMIWARIALVVSIAAFVLLPDVGAHHDVLYDGAMRGIYIHKNGMARILAIGIFAELFSRQRPWTRLSWIVAWVAAGILTESLSFFVLAAAFAAMLLVLRGVKWNDRRSVGVFVAIAHVMVGVGIAAAVLFGPSIIESTGRFSAEDDRGRIWQGALTLFQMKPFGGWGYGTVFRPDSVAGQIINVVSGWTPTAAHNGYMNALAEGGLLGIGTMVITLLLGIIVTWRARERLIWPFVYAVALAANNLTDTRTSGIELFIFAAGILYVTTAKHSGRDPQLPEPRVRGVDLVDPPRSKRKRMSGDRVSVRC